MCDLGRILVASCCVIAQHCSKLNFFKVTFGQLLPDKNYWSLGKRTLCVKNLGLDNWLLHSNSSFKTLLFILRRSQIAIDKNANAAIPSNLTSCSS